MPRLLRRFGYQLTVLGLIGLVGSLGLFVILVMLPDLRAGAAAPTAAPSPSSTAPFAVMSWIDLPADADCAACHQTETGIGVRPVPQVAHPLRGWTDCIACHANDRLVTTAGGHAGLHATDCLVCHEPAVLPVPLSRPHRAPENQDCLNCHGRTEPLPADMAHRAESVCWLCHRVSDEPPPAPQHPITAGQVDCLSCHNAGDLGALPEDHLTRTVEECLLCHVPSPGSSVTPRPDTTSTPGSQQGVRWPLVFARPS